ncbi:MAG: diaminopimelate epimerase [Lachnospiraceae bacterium]|nr:diaminopimelate epimerase [Lachnospiraceae bacterium]
MKFTKMHGIGNDYVYVNCFEETVENPSEVSKFVSDRHFGIGSDGLILIKPSDVADFEMDMYNEDGSRGKMCGNGIRCVAKYVYDKGLTDKTNISINTLSGIKYLDLTVENGKVSSVKVNMGAPITKAKEVPVASDKEIIVSQAFSAKEGKLVDKAYDSAKFDHFNEDSDLYRITCVSMGNPHCIIFTDEEVKNIDLPKFGPRFEKNAFFPESVNTEFVNVIKKNELCMRVWERGSGETLACGTGACAVAVAAILNGYADYDTNVLVHLLGGDLRIKWDKEKDLVFMTGPATIVYDGIIDLSE